MKYDEMSAMFIGSVLTAMVMGVMWWACSNTVEQAKINAGYLTHHGAVYKVTLEKDFAAERKKLTENIKERK